MPGASVTKKYVTEDETNAWGFTYSTRLVWYPLNPEWGACGRSFWDRRRSGSNPEYKTGVRWEPNQHAAWAITYGQEFNGNQCAGIERGVMIFTPQFACIGPCKIKR